MTTFSHIADHSLRALPFFLYAWLSIKYTPLTTLRNLERAKKEGRAVNTPK